MTNMNISMPSVASVYIRMRWQGKEMGATGTGFVVVSNGQPFLITNRHNLSGENSETGALLSSYGVAPDEIAIMHNKSNRLGEWVERFEPLKDSEEAPLWLEHSTYGKTVDVVALPLTKLDDVALFPYKIALPENPPEVVVSGDSSIVGFPFGKRAHGYMAIWLRGAIASEPSLDYEGLPRFLVDARTRPGQSGSPVLQHLSAGPVTLANGDRGYTDRASIQLLGVYSGRISSESDIGIVWRRSVIREILGIV